MIVVSNPFINHISLGDTREANRTLEMKYIENQGLIWTLKTPSPYKMFIIDEEGNPNVHYIFNHLFNEIAFNSPYVPLFEKDGLIIDANIKNIMYEYNCIYDDIRNSIMYLSDETNPNLLQIFNHNDEIILIFTKNNLNVCTHDEININIDTINPKFKYFYVPFISNYENMLSLVRKK